MSQSILKGAICVAIGASSYGLLATFVKLAYQESFTTAEISTAQFIYGIIFTILMALLLQKFSKKPIVAPCFSERKWLLIAGTSTGMTSVFYYASVQYIDVSVSIILLMQSVWLGVMIEAFLTKKWPSWHKILAVVIILLGSLLATNIFERPAQIDIRGIIWGSLAAISFTTTLFTSSRVAPKVHFAWRSFYMLSGGLVIILLFWMLTKEHAFNFLIFKKWGLILALFGTIIPPTMFNIGFPKTGIGLGSILATIELPVSVAMAYFIINEQVIAWQWLGIVLILLAVILLNASLLFTSKNKKI